MLALGLVCFVGRVLSFGSGSPSHQVGLFGLFCMLDVTRVSKI